MELKYAPTAGLQNEHTLTCDQFLLLARITEKTTGILAEHER